MRFCPAVIVRSPLFARSRDLANFGSSPSMGLNAPAGMPRSISFGVTPISDYLKGDLAPARRPDGFVAVRPTLQVEGHDTVFAIGDVSTADAKMAGLAGRQAQVVAENIVKLVNGDADLASYEPYGPAIIVPIGPEGGSGQLPGQEELSSAEMVATVKGRDLMVDRYAEILGLTTSAP